VQLLEYGGWNSMRGGLPYGWEVIVTVLVIVFIIGGVMALV